MISQKTLSGFTTLRNFPRKTKGAGFSTIEIAGATRLRQVRPDVRSVWILYPQKDNGPQQPNDGEFVHSGSSRGTPLIKNANAVMALVKLASAASDKLRVRVLHSLISLLKASEPQKWNHEALCSAGMLQFFTNAFSKALRINGPKAHSRMHLLSAVSDNTEIEPLAMQKPLDETRGARVAVHSPFDECSHATLCVLTNAEHIRRLARFFLMQLSSHRIESADLYQQLALVPDDYARTMLAVSVMNGFSSSYIEMSLRQKGFACLQIPPLPPKSKSVSAAPQQAESNILSFATWINIRRSINFAKEWHNANQQYYIQSPNPLLSWQSKEANKASSNRNSTSELQVLAQCDASMSRPLAKPRNQ